MKQLSTLFLVTVITLFLVSCNQTPKELIEISTIDVTVDLDTLEISTDQKGYTVEITENELNYTITFTASSKYGFGNNMPIYVNDILIVTRESSDSRLGTLVAYTFKDFETFNPDATREIQVHYDLNGGYFTSSYFGEHEFTTRSKLTSYGDIGGLSFTFFDTSNTTLRSFYKLFIKYNEAYDAYEIVYRDPATADIIDLDLPDYDYVLAVHAQTTDISTREKIISYTQESSSSILILFDQDIAQYESGDMNVSFYHEHKFSGIIEAFEKEAFDLPVPIRENFEFLG